MEHKITYEMKGVSRKELSKAISEVLNTASVYKGVPSCAYEIGNLILDREGSIILGDTMTVYANLKLGQLAHRKLGQYQYN